MVVLLSLVTSAALNIVFGTQWEFNKYLDEQMQMNGGCER